MLVTTKGRYALKLMVRIAQAGEGGKVSLREAAEEQGMSAKYLEQLVRPLAQANLVKSVRGQGGGYCLTRPATEVRAGDVLRAVEGTTIPVACQGIEGMEACPQSDKCSTVHFWQGLDEVIETYVDGVTLADLAASGTE